MASGEIAASSFNVTFDAVDGAKSYVVHYINEDTDTPSELTSMGYTETPKWTLDDDLATAPIANSTFTLAVQAYREKGVGENQAEKARYLHDGEFLGSEWSTPLLKVTTPSE